jgi:hypothetical protein
MLAKQFIGRKFVLNQSINRLITRGNDCSEVYIEGRRYLPLEDKRREGERKRKRESERQRDRESEKETETETERQGDRETDPEKDTESGTERGTGTISLVNINVGEFSEHSKKRISMNRIVDFNVHFLRNEVKILPRPEMRSTRRPA